MGRKGCRETYRLRFGEPAEQCVLLAVELDDSSHELPDRIARDEFVEEVVETAGIRPLRMRARASYDLTELSNRLAELVPLVYR
jgi:hypothetical protein